MSLRALSLALMLPNANAAQAEVILACSFPTLPPVVMTFPDGVNAQKLMSVGGRPAVPLIEGQGAGRVISATVDGYDFRFSPQDKVMDVDQGGSTIAAQTGVCVTIGGPVNDTPLQIALPETEAPTPVVDAGTAPQPAAAPTDRGNWHVSEETSAFDDSRTVALSLQSNEPVRAPFGAPAPANLYLRCQENTTALFIVMNDLFLSDIQGFGSVDYRVDDRKAEVARMSSSTDNKALGLWAGGSAIPFIKKLLAGQRIVFRVTPYNESPVEVSFTLAGLDAAIVPLKEACKWQ